MKRLILQADRLGLALVVLAGVLVYGSSLSAYGQAAEQEPNHPCPSAQNLGAVALPFTLDGSLDSTGGFYPPPDAVRDVDFFRFTGTPGALMQADLEGQSTGKGTLPDPLLGLFDSNCSLLATADGGGVVYNSRLVFTVPADGVFVLGATTCCDYPFIGGGVGSYQLTVDRFRAIGSIRGRVIDAATGSPLSGLYPQLLRCDGGGCFPVYLFAYAGTDGEGRFRFERDASGNPLPVGTYQVQVSAGRYSISQTDPVAVGEGEHKDLGDIALTPIPVIGSISGQVVDAATGQGLAGSTDPFTNVWLNFCDPSYTYCSFATQSTDSQGRFRFERDAYGNPLLIGSYSLNVNADQYYPLYSSFNMAEGEHRNLGHLSLQSYPVRFTAITPCANIPSSGGVCRYTLRVTNGMTTALDGATWSIVNAYMPGAFTGSTFQTGVPQRLRLASGQGQTVQFDFRVPPGVPDWASICTLAYVSKDSTTLLFNTVGQRYLFCISKGGPGGFTVMPADKFREMIRRWQSPGVLSRPR